jgi:hypothetical protein
MKLRTHFNVVPRSKRVELYLHSPITSSWRSATLPFYPYVFSYWVTQHLRVGKERFCQHNYCTLYHIQLFCQDDHAVDLVVSRSLTTAVIHV